MYPIESFANADLFRRKTIPRNVYDRGSNVRAVAFTDPDYGSWYSLYPVLYCVLGGFDTHGGQIERLTDLYEDFSVSLSRFAADLKRSGHWKDTLVFVYSDFGRTIDENASGGTDQGFSGLSLLAGGDLSAFSSFADISSIPSRVSLTDWASCSWRTSMILGRC